MCSAAPARRVVRSARILVSPAGPSRAAAGGGAALWPRLYCPRLLPPESTGSALLFAASILAALVTAVAILALMAAVAVLAALVAAILALMAAVAVLAALVTPVLALVAAVAVLALMAAVLALVAAVAVLALALMAAVAVLATILAVAFAAALAVTLAALVAVAVAIAITAVAIAIAAVAAGVAAVAAGVAAIAAGIAVPAAIPRGTASVGRFITVTGPIGICLKGGSVAAAAAIGPRAVVDPVAPLAAVVATDDGIEPLAEAVVHHVRPGLGGGATQAEDDHRGRSRSK